MTRWISGIALVLIGTFGVVLAILMPTVVAPAAKKTPLDLNITQISSGPAKVFDLASGQVKDVRLRATRIVRTDTSASDGTNTTVNESLCIVIVNGDTPNCVSAADPRLLSVTTDRVTANRKSAEAVHVAGWNENVNGDTSVRHVGLSYKWPIDAARKTYQFYQPDVKKAFPARYIDSETIQGLLVDKYVSATGDQPYKILGIADGTYNDTRTVWIEPRTGAIIDGVEHQVQTLSDGTVALDTTLSFEQSAIDYQANFAKSKIGDLRTAQIYVPLIAGVVGLAALAGAFLLLRRRGAQPGRHAEGDGPDGDGPDSGGGPGDSYDDGPLLTGTSQT